MLHKQIWDTLSTIDVTPGIEKKNGLDYLSWSFAWSQVKKYFPDIITHFSERDFPDGTMEVTCRITIRQGEETATHEMWLPVINYANRPIKNPDAFAVNTSKQRCLVKCFCLFGLGIGVYGGSVDLVEQAPEAKITKSEATKIRKMLKDSGADVEKFLNYFGAPTIDQLPADRWDNIIGMLEAKIAAKEQSDASAE